MPSGGGAGRLVRRLQRSELVKHGSLVFASTMLGSVFLYAFHFIVSRWLGVERYGVLTSLIALVSLFLVPAMIGTTIVARFAAEFEALDDRAKLRRLCDVLARWSAVTVVVAVALGFALGGPIGAFLHVDDIPLIVLTALAAALNVVLPVLRGVLQGAQRFTSFAVSVIVENAGKTLLGVLLVLGGFGVVGAIGGLAAGLAIASLYTLWSLRATFAGVPERLRIDLRRLVSTTIGIALSIFGVTTLMYFDVVLAKHYLSAQQAGLYGGATLTGRALSMVISFLPTVLLPKATARATSGEPAGRLVLQSLGIAAALAAVALSFYALFPELIIRIFAGPLYAAAAPLVFPLGVATGMLAMANVVITYKIGLHRFDFIAPVLVVLLGEVAFIARFHANPQEIIRTLLVGHALALASTIWRLGA